MNLNLQQQIGQMVMAQAFGRFRSTAAAEFCSLRGLVADHGVGGFKLYHGYALGTILLTAHLQQAAPLPLLMAADLEQGLGQQVGDALRFPPLAALGTIGDPQLARQAGQAIAADALRLGINTLFGPLLDLHTRHDVYFGLRSLGGDPLVVAELGTAFAQGVRAAGALPIAKYFPGHGRQHLLADGSSIVAAAPDALAQYDWLPFREAIRAGLPAIMVSHGAFPPLDNTCWPSAAGTVPAALSRAIVDGLLRHRFGFKGLIVSDALNLPFLRRAFSARQIARQAVAAGVDLLVALSQPQDATDAIVGVWDALEAGEIDEQRIADAAGRVLAVKAGLLKVPTLLAGGTLPAESIGTDQTLNLIETIAVRSVTVLKCPSEGFPLRQRPITVSAVVLGSVEQCHQIRSDPYRPWHTTALPQGVTVSSASFSPDVTAELLEPMLQGSHVLLMPLSIDAGERLETLVVGLRERNVCPILLLPIAVNAARRLANLGWASVWLADSHQACRTAALALLFGEMENMYSPDQLRHRPEPSVE